MRQSLRLVSGLYLKLSLLTIAVGFLLRIVLLFNEQTTDLSFSFGEWLQVFLLGAVNDFCAATAGAMAVLLTSANTSRANYVWLPITFEEGKPKIHWRDSWKLSDFE